MAQLLHQSSSILKDFSETTERVDGRTDQSLYGKTLLRTLSKELANLEKKAEVLGDAYAAVE